jgi:hypothetical protein
MENLLLIVFGFAVWIAAGIFHLRKVDKLECEIEEWKRKAKGELKVHTADNGRRFVEIRDVIEHHFKQSGGPKQSVSPPKKQEYQPGQWAN